MLVDKLRVRRTMTTLVAVVVRAVRSRSVVAAMAAMRAARHIVAFLDVVERARAAADAAAADAMKAERNADIDDDDATATYEAQRPTEDRLLPTVHALWAPTLARVSDSRVVVALEALATLEHAATLARSFLGVRGARELWPSTRALIDDVVSSRSGATSDNARRRAVAALACVDAFVRHCELPLDALTSIATSCDDWRRDVNNSNNGARVEHDVRVALDTLHADAVQQRAALVDADTRAPQCDALRDE